jgi:hypothetical protein
MKKVKIVSASGGFIPELTWYSNRIGQVFSVVGPADNNAIFVSLEEHPPMVGHISSGDYELVGDDEKTEQDKVWDEFLDLVRGCIDSSDGSFDVNNFMSNRDNYVILRKHVLL